MKGIKNIISLHLGVSLVFLTAFGVAGADNAASGGLYRAPLTILSPMDYQVFQRQTAKEGRILISGRITSPCDKLEYRLNNGTWRVVAGMSSMGGFAAELNAPAGGWYRCEFRALKDSKEIAAKVIEHVGVGEVFVAAGQSNASNNGAKKLKPASGMVSTFSGRGLQIQRNRLSLYDGEWRLADDPQPGCHDLSNSGSFYPPLGDLLYEKFKVPIAFAVTAHGGTSVAWWLPDADAIYNDRTMRGQRGDLFDWMETRILQLGAHGFRAVLWHQGEADAVTPEAVYYNSLKTIIEESNLRAGWVFPWVVNRVGGAGTKQAKAHLISEGMAIDGGDSDTLQGPENRQGDGKSAHFTELGLRRHAALWAEKLIPFITNETQDR